MKKESRLPMIGAYVTIVAFIYLIGELIVWKAIPLNPATWVMWTILDATIVYSTPIGNPMRKVMLGFTIGAGLIATITIGQLLAGKTSWVWSAKETLTTICFVATLLFRKACVSQILALNVGATAMFIAGIPMWVAAWQSPKDQDPIFWGTCTLGWAITLAGTPRSFARWYMPVGGMMFNGYVAVLAMGAKDWF